MPFAQREPAFSPFALPAQPRASQPVREAIESGVVQAGKQFTFRRGVVSSVAIAELVHHGRGQSDQPVALHDVETGAATEAVQALAQAERGAPRIAVGPQQRSGAPPLDGPVDGQQRQQRRIMA